MPDTERQGPEAVIVLGTPSSGFSPDEFNQTMMRMQFASRGKYHIVPVSCQGSSIAHNQNNIVKGAREVSAQLQSEGHRGVDAIFFIENDESFRNAEEVIDRLWMSGKDIVGATYCFKFPDRIRVMGVEENGDPIEWLSLYHREPLTKVLALPIGALMVRMNVFDELDKEVFQGIDQNGEILTMTEAPVFQHDIHFSTKLVRTTDYVFCCRARKAGFDVWLDAPLSLEIEHWGKYPFSLPHPGKVSRQLATVQSVADAYAKEAEARNDREIGEMANDLYAVAATMARQSGIFSLPRKAKGETE